MKINRSRVEFYLQHIRCGGHFEIDLCRYGGDITNDIAKTIANRVINPLWNARAESKVFGIQRKVRRSIDSSPRQTHEQRETNIEQDEHLLERIIEGKEPDKNFVFCVPEERIPVSEIAKNSWDPQYVANLTSVASKISLNYCREHVKRENQCCFLLYRTALGVSMSIHAQHQTLENLYTACVRSCRFTGSGLEKELRG